MTHERQVIAAAHLFNLLRSDCVPSNMGHIPITPKKAPNKDHTSSVIQCVTKSGPTSTLVAGGVNLSPNDVVGLERRD